MGMMKKTFISGAVLACSLQASVANAACVPPVGPVSSLLPPAADQVEGVPEVQLQHPVGGVLRQVGL